MKSGTELRTKHHNSLIARPFPPTSCHREMRCYSTSKARPGNIFHPDFERGLPTYFDLTVRNSLRPPFLIKQPLVCRGSSRCRRVGDRSTASKHGLNYRRHFLSYCGGDIGSLVTKQSTVLKTIVTRTCFHNKLLLVSLCAICFNNSLVNYGCTTLERFYLD